MTKSIHDNFQEDEEQESVVLCNGREICSLFREEWGNCARADSANPDDVT